MAKTLPSSTKDASCPDMRTHGRSAAIEGDAHKLLVKSGRRLPQLVTADLHGHWSHWSLLPLLTEVRASRCIKLLLVPPSCEMKK
jgi:hypothetical protein